MSSIVVREGEGHVRQGTDVPWLNAVSFIHEGDHVAPGCTGRTNITRAAMAATPTADFSAPIARSAPMSFYLDGLCHRVCAT